MIHLFRLSLRVEILRGLQISRPGSWGIGLMNAGLEFGLMLTLTVQIFYSAHPEP